MVKTSICKKKKHWHSEKDLADISLIHRTDELNVSQMSVTYADDTDMSVLH